ncbi:glycosyltransferase [Vibrio celticus]|uniref:glycosyltransferase n=1 Tax=Vibrio celticus TaxID=446372 RepID=UPI0021C3C4E3|nr:glycosyltransferase [Vibrio celticus]
MFLLNTEEKKILNIKVKRCEVIPNGVDDTTYFLIEGHKENYISFLSRYDYFGKGIDVLLDSIGEIKNFLTEKKVKIRMHGSFPTSLDRELIFKHVKKLNLEEIVFIGGAIYGNDKYEFLANSRLMLLPSRSEGMPMVVLEALSVDTYCLVSPHCNVEEILSSCGGGDVSELTSAEFSKSIKRKVVSCRDIRTREYIFDNYSWGSISDKYINIYRSL